MHRAVQSFPTSPYPNWFIWWCQKNKIQLSIEPTWIQDLQQDQHTWGRDGNLSHHKPPHQKNSTTPHQKNSTEKFSYC